MAAASPATKVAVVYVVVAGAWILLSDWALEAIPLTAGAEAWAQTGKGVGFVVITAALLWVGLDRAWKRQLAAEEQSRRAQRLESIGRLAGGIAHDFNNLLTAIVGYAGLLLRDRSIPASATKDLEAIQEASQKAATLTHRLLAFSRRQALERRVVDLNEVIRSCDTLLQRIVRESIDLRMSLDAGLWPVKADPAQLEQVLMNLVVNGVDAMPEGGEIVVETENVVLGKKYVAQRFTTVPGEYVRLTVTDTGVGMDEATIARVFEPFFTTKGEEGTGLGLATTYGIVKQHGGYIWPYSQVGRGTTLKIYLPRAEGTPEPYLRSPRRPVHSRATATVLLVEDQDEVRELVRRILKDYGYTVLDARGPEEALRLLEEHRGDLDVLVTDVVMPAMDGMQLAEQVRQAAPDVKVLFMSGYSAHFAFDGEVPEGAAFLSKPFDPNDLARRVAALVEEGEGT